MVALAVAFAVALAITWFVTPFVVKLAVRCGAIAVPRDRDVHKKPMPRWGGIAIFVGVLAASAITLTYRQMRPDVSHAWTWQIVGLFLAGTLIALIGMLDDVKELSARWQIVGILSAGVILYAFGVRIEGISNPLVAEHPLHYDARSWIQLAPAVSVIATLFWVFLVTKTVDAIDGLDGLAAGVCAISAATLALMGIGSHQPDGPSVALIAASLVGACVGFLRHNYNPAKIFMSTVGSQFLGLMLAGLSILGTFKIAAAISVLVPVLVLGVPIFDYGVVLFKRLINHAPLTKADRRHLHHRLLDHGLSQRQAVWVIYGCTVVLCGTALVLFHIHR